MSRSAFELGRVGVLAHHLPLVVGEYTHPTKKSGGINPALHQAVQRSAGFIPPVLASQAPAPTCSYEFVATSFGLAAFFRSASITR
jgi:hypothetical protein